MICVLWRAHVWGFFAGLCCGPLEWWWSHHVCVDCSEWPHGRRWVKLCRLLAIEDGLFFLVSFPNYTIATKVQESKTQQHKWMNNALFLLLMSLLWYSIFEKFIFSGSFTWNLDFNDPLQALVFNAWRPPNEPNGGGGENCVELRYPSPFFFLWVLPCMRVWRPVFQIRFLSSLLSQVEWR